MGKILFRQVHLDFHTSEAIVGVGDKFDAREFAETLAEAHVNSVTCFSRCHHGMIYYDTQFKEARHPALKINLLGEQIDACHAVGIRVPVYVTVGWDEFIASRHPEWLEVTPNGGISGPGPLEAGWRKLCLNTPYVDYVRAQTLEVLSLFDVDGFFFDILWQNQCCCTRCLRDMLNAGLNPENEEDRLLFASQVLDGVKKRLTSEVRKVNKTCTIFYNSGHISPAIRNSLDAYTHIEVESLPSGGWGYHHFPITARYARTLGYEFLGMTGKFHEHWGDFGGFKTKAALEYECFSSLSLGGKCSIGDQLHPSGQITKATYELIGDVYKGVAEKEEWCDDVTPVVEIAIFTPEAVMGTDTRAADDSLRGAYRILEEAHYQYDVVDQHADFNRYKVMIFPDKIRFDKELRDKVEQYLENGGSAIFSHASGLDAEANRFVLDKIGVVYESELEYSPDFLVAEEAISHGILNSEHCMYERGFKVNLLPGTEVLAKVWKPYFNRTYKHFCSHRHTPVEGPTDFAGIVKNGSVIYFAYPIFGMYQRHGAIVYKQFVLNSLELLLKDKLVKTDAPTTAHITLNHQENNRRFVAHILHYIPERRSNNMETIEDVIPLYNVSLAVALPERVKQAYLAPSREELEMKCEGKYVSVLIPKVSGHQMVVFEY